MKEQIAKNKPIEDHKLEDVSGGLYWDPIEPPSQLARCAGCGGVLSVDFSGGSPVFTCPVCDRKES